MNFDDLLSIVAKLRGPEGCPWDREQTRESLRPFLIEELYEFVDALDEDDTEGMKEELGDFLFQIILQSQLAKEEGRFDIHEVVDAIAQKMIRRHPHVFGGKDLKTSEEVVLKWQEHKKNEGKVYDSAIGGVPRALPALLRASKIQQKATRVGFDWERVEDMFAKLEEEIKEFKEALKSKDRMEIEDELGDMFFVLVRIANFADVDPENALRRTIDKFTRRFTRIEEEAAKEGRKLSEMTLAEMDVLWNKAKRELK